MTAVVQLHQAFDHGAALRVPPAHDARNWRNLWTWLGDCGLGLDEPGAVQVLTPDGFSVARPGDWIVLSVSGDFHVARGGRRAWDA
jgi:hypothetical protein